MTPNALPSVPSMMSISAIIPSRSATPAPRGPYMPTAWTFDIGHGAIFLGERHGSWDVGDIAVHRIDALEGDQFGERRIGRSQQLFEMVQVIVAENVLLALMGADPADHRIVVQRIGENHQARQDLVQGRED